MPLSTNTKQPEMTAVKLFFINIKFLFKRIIRLNLLYPYSLNWRMITKIDNYIYVRTINKKLMMKQAFKSLVQAYPNLPADINTDFLFIKSLIRSDYDEFFNSVYENCNYDRAKTNITYKEYNFRYYVKLIKLLYYFPIFLKLYQKDLKLTFYCYLKAITYISVLNCIKKYKFNTIIAFADMQGVENMLIQYFNKHGKKTVTLQHGLYIDYSEFDNINTVNYLNVVSQNFLAWGQETKGLIKKYHSDVQVVICGKPIYMIKRELSSTYFTLVFDQNLFTEQNRELLAIAYSVSTEMGIKVNVRLHPWDRRERYKFNDGLTTFDQDIVQSIFVIGHTTSMIFECMRNGIPAFKYKTKYPSNVVSNDLTFTNTEELIQRIQNIDKYNFTELGKYYLEYVGDESLQQYASFFNSLRNNNLKQ